MAINLAERSLKKGFFTDDKGENLIEFQFNPTEIVFNEESRIESETHVGEVNPNMLWVSSAPEDFYITLFVDRSDESRGTQGRNFDASDLIGKKQYHYIGAGLDQMVRTAKARVEGTAGRYGLESIIRGDVEADPNLMRSEYNPSPHVNPNDIGFNKNVGVWNEYQKFKKYMRPRGWEEDVNLSNYNSLAFNLALLEAGRWERQQSFTSPPLAIMFFGDLWIEGYFRSLRPRFSVMTRNLTPQRMEVEIILSIHRKGIISPTQTMAQREEVIA